MVLSRGEVRAIIDALCHPIALLVELMYGGGLRLGEACSLRIKDLDLERQQIIIRQGKGQKDPVTLLSEASIPALNKLIEDRRSLHQRDLAKGEGWVELPFAFERKQPKAAWSFPWQSLFAARGLSSHPISGQQGSWHIHDSTVQKAVFRTSMIFGFFRV